MYTAYFGFNNKPFKPREPKDFYRNANFDAVCADILDSIRERRGFVLLTGEAGVGKSLVLRRCMADADDIRFIRLVNATIGFPDILSYLYAHLELPVADLDVEQRSRAILENLAAESRHNRAIALLIDDAQHLSVDTLFRLHEFVETPLIPTQRLQVILAGLPDLVETLADPRLHALRDSIRIHCRLERLSTLETGMLINHQLKIAGYDGDALISPAAMERICSYCQGVPRSIAILCDSILMLASLQAEQSITPALVDEAAQSCFLGDPSRSVDEGESGLAPATATENADFDLDLSVFDSAFDVGHQDLAVKPSNKTSHSPAGSLADAASDWAQLPFEADAAAGTDQTVAVPFGGRRLADTWADALADAAPTVAVPFSGKKAVSDQAETIALVAPPKPVPAAPPVSPALNEFIQLLEEVAAKPHRVDSDREALQYFQTRYLRWSKGGEPARWVSFEQRISQMATIQQLLMVGLVTLFRATPGQESVLCALLLNPTWWLYREIRLRLRSTDLVFANEGQMPPLRLLDGRSAEVVYLTYRHAGTDSAQATVWLELDLCDHRGEWHAYNNSTELKLDLPTQSGGVASSEDVIESIEQHDRFWPEPLSTQAPVVKTWLLAEPPSQRNLVSSEGANIGNLMCTFPIELERDAARTTSLRSRNSIAHTLGRGTPLTRALLLAADPVQAPARIELVSRPFMIFGRHSSTAGTGFGDFTLGFVPKYTRISRLHCVVCALGDQLALMPVSDVGNTYTGRNAQRLERGNWEILEENDTLNICELYRLKLTLAWDQKSETTPSAWDINSPREKFGSYLLDLVEVLRKRDRQTGTEELHNMLRDRYLTLLHAQDRVAQLNGVGNPGALLYARFEREDAANRQVIHFYVPKWLSLGSAPEAGLRIRAEGVKPHHAELLFRDGLYWIQNLADAGTVQVGHHGLATNEVLALEAGDILMIGGAKFTFEAY